jgi:hypothetical protein
MIKTMQARYAGRDAITGREIRPGDQIQYDTSTRRAWLAEPGDMADLDDEQRDVIDHPSRYNPAWISHVWTSGGREYYRNKAGRCEDAPCCGCCTA